MTYPEAAWEVIAWPEVEIWLHGLDGESQSAVVAVIDRLAERGPLLGRPHADRVNGSRHHNMKELRPTTSSTSAIRILFVFDPRQRAILLVAGDKAGNWKRWYQRNIRIADRQYDEWLARWSGDE